MHVGLSYAVRELRRRLELSQEELAHAIDKHGATATDHVTVSRWERGVEAPSPSHRTALAKIADRHKQKELGDIFRASITAWRLVARLKFDIGDES
jgi:transcriptional regulator with XRE-family HTH domain